MYQKCYENFKFLLFMVYFHIFFKICKCNVKAYFKSTILLNNNQKGGTYNTYKLDTSSILG